MPIKVLVVGAGPAGLAFAIALANRGADHDITVVDRCGPTETPGWGVTLRPQAFDLLKLDAIVDGPKLQGRALWYRGTPIVDLPNPSAGALVTTARAALVHALRARAASVGVRFRWNTNASGLPLDGHDLVVAADGAYSPTRARFAEHLQPTQVDGGNYYVWLGTTKVFPKLTIMLRDDPIPMLGWAYQYSEAQSTLILEVSAQTYERLDVKAATETALARALDVELSGHPVQVAGEPKWRKFPIIRCKKLVHANIALIGDAAHTTHFSQGFGTIFAFDDALALCNALQAEPRIDEALYAYERGQQPKVDAFQSTSIDSMRWAEAMTNAADSRDESAVHVLVAQRWPDNTVTRGPLMPEPDRPTDDAT